MAVTVQRVLIRRYLMSETLMDIAGRWNKNSNGVEIVRQGAIKQDVPRIPFSSSRMNYSSYGGMPRGRIVEFFGAEGSGKTTTALDLVANAQYVLSEEFESFSIQYAEELEKLKASKAGKNKIQFASDRLKNLVKQRVIFLDLENTLDTEWAEHMGVDVEDLIIITPESESAEEILTYVLEMLETGEVGALFLDSIPYLVPAQIQNSDMTKKMYGGISSTLTDFVKIATPYITRYNILFLAINQVREDLSNPYAMYSTPGGRMWKHACSVRYQFRKGKFTDDKGNELTNSAENPSGNIVEATLQKSKVFRPNRRIARYRIDYYTGIVVEEDLLDISVELGLVDKAGSWYRMGDENGEYMQFEGEVFNYQGRLKAIQALKDNALMYDYLMDKVYPLISD